jgi:hypothetical protein
VALRPRLTTDLPFRGPKLCNFAALSTEGMIEFAARLSNCAMLFGSFLEHDVPTLALTAAPTDLPIYICDHAPS